MNEENEDDVPEDDLPEEEVPEGAAIFPIIPEELGINPLLLAAVHSVVFFYGSSEDVIHDAAADESLQYISSYLQRLQGADLKRVREDMECLVGFAKQEDWGKDMIEFLQDFLREFGVGEEADE